MNKMGYITSSRGVKGIKVKVIEVQNHQIFENELELYLRDGYYLEQCEVSSLGENPIYQALLVRW